MGERQHGVAAVGVKKCMTTVSDIFFVGAASKTKTMTEVESWSLDLLLSLTQTDEVFIVSARDAGSGKVRPSRPRCLTAIYRTSSLC